MQLAIAVLGVTLGALSLGWQAATYVLNGGRVRVEFRVGAIADDGSGLVTAAPSNLRPRWAEDLAEQGYSRLVVVVRVRNKGRLPVTIERWTIISPRGVSLSPTGGSSGPDLPHRLETGASETWWMPFADVQRFAEVTKATLPEVRRGGSLMHGRTHVDDDLRAVVELGDGRTKRSHNVLPMAN